MQPDRLYVQGMLDARSRIIELTADHDTAAIEASPTVRDALLWNFTVLGEAANQVSDSLRTEHADIPWRRATGLRNRIVHGYWSTDTDVLVSTARTAIPDLRARLLAVIDILTD